MDAGCSRYGGVFPDGDLGAVCCCCCSESTGGGCESCACWTRCCDAFGCSRGDSSGNWWLPAADCML